MEVSLEQLLESRDRRHELQASLLRRYPRMTLVCVTVVMPGKEKRNQYSLAIAKSAMYALRTATTPLHILFERDLVTGYEAYVLSPMSPIETKRLACRIEESAPLGRLFDIDVIGKDGIPLSRESVGYGPRRCLLCDNDARFCMRNHSHTQEEVLNHIKQLVRECTTNTK